MAEDLGERSEQATPRRLQEAREEGRIAKSTDLAGALKLAAMTLVLAAIGMTTATGMHRLLDQALADIGQTEVTAVWSGSVAVLATAAAIMAPILGVAWLISYLSYFVQVGWLVSGKSVQPDLGRLNPVKGFQRLFSLSSLVKTLLDVGKLTLVVAVAVIIVVSFGPEIIVLPQLEPQQDLAVIGGMVFRLALAVVLVLLILGIIDFVYQRWKFQKDLRMTKQEIKEEYRQSEGDPEVKKRRFRMQQQLAMQRLSSSVPRADVIVTNPEHISIAIAYQPNQMAAPRVVAKGADYVAIRIRQIAMQHGIPIIERKPLARALYRDVEVGHEIPESFYKAVAEILAYVYRLKGKVA